ncbi:hypothetical protein PENTCL1PPCAC_2422, partial [Pristionchus entomophagus]
LKIPHIPRENIIVKKLLGRGAFGEVYQAEIQGESEINVYDVAVKTMSLKVDTQTQIDFSFESITLHKLNHCNIVRAIGINTEADPYYFIMEYMRGGSLESFLRMYRNGKFSNVKITMNMGDFYKMAVDVAAGCEYLESNHYVHRDIAARNCLLTTRTEGRIVKLADFGMARDVYNVDSYQKNGRSKIPVKWMPPESYMDGEFTSKADVWSYGVLLWEIFSLSHMPYPGLSNFQVMETVQLGKRLLPPHGCPSSVYKLMMSTWRVDPDRRPSFKHLLFIFQTWANDGFESNQCAPPGKVPFGLMDMNEDGGWIERDYPNITLPQLNMKEIGELDEENEESNMDDYMEDINDDLKA